eukprot:Skav216555  [mRNA]  locus=scaffold1776:371722:371922:+ [translate_table: standard]
MITTLRPHRRHTTRGAELNIAFRKLFFQDLFTAAALVMCMDFTPEAVVCVAACGSDLGVALEYRQL